MVSMQYYCENCNMIVTREFEEYEDLNVFMGKMSCPVCEGTKITVIPQRLKAVCRNVVLKGYKLKGIYLGQIGIEIDHYKDIPEEILASVPVNDGFIYNRDKNNIIIYNKELFNNTIPDHEVTQYSVKAVINLLNWVRNFPTVGLGNEADYKDIIGATEFVDTSDIVMDEPVESFSMRPQVSEEN